jgi:hypothetical protein
MPSADCCCELKEPYHSLSHESATRNRSPEVSSTTFRAQPPGLQPVSFMDMGFAVGLFARHRVPQIRFLYIASYAPRFLRTPHEDALPLRYPFTSIRL